jgi:hypothetical protein
MTALGRQEEWEDSPEGYPQTPPYVWWNWHDEYGDAGLSQGWLAKLAEAAAVITSSRPIDPMTSRFATAADAGRGRPMTTRKENDHGESET